VAGPAGPPARWGIGPPRSTGVRKGSSTGDRYVWPSVVVADMSNNGSLNEVVDRILWIGRPAANCDGAELDGSRISGEAHCPQEEARRSRA